MTMVDFVSDRMCLSQNVKSDCMEMGWFPHMAPETLAADIRYLVLQYSVAIFSIFATSIEYGRFIWNLSKLHSRHKTFS